MQVDSATIVLLLLLVGIATGGLTGASGMSVLISGLLMMGIDIRGVIGLTFLVTLVNSMTSVIPDWRGQLIDLRLAAFLSLSAMLAVIVRPPAGRPSSRFVAASRDDCGIVPRRIACHALPQYGASSGRNRSQTAEFPSHPAGDVDRTDYGGDGWWRRPVHRSRADDRLPDTGQAGNRYFDFSKGATAVPGLVLHGIDHTTNWLAGGVIAASSILTAFASAQLATRIPVPIVKRLLGGYLLVISVLLVLKSL